MGYRPLLDRVAIVREDSEEKTEGGLIIPESAQEKPQKGRVVAAGVGTRKDGGGFEPLLVKVGDVVYFTKWSGSEIKIGGEDILIMKESDILLVDDE